MLYAGGDIKAVMERAASMACGERQLVPDVGTERIFGTPNFAEPRQDRGRACSALNQFPSPSSRWRSEAMTFLRTEM